VSDGEAIVTAVLLAKENPEVRPVNAAKIARRSGVLATKIGPVTVPDVEEAVPQKYVAGSEPRNILKFNGYC
jgi:hypothetical protein